MKTTKYDGASFDDFVNEQLQDKAFRKVFNRERVISELVQTVINYRKDANMTQAALAKRCNTTQQVIARLEKGNNNRLPSLDLLARIAAALGKELTVSIS